MSKKPIKRQAILEYAKNNPMATPPEVAKACGTHPTYTYMTMRNANAKKPKAAKPDFEFKQEFPEMLVKQINALREENEDLKDAMIRMDGVIKYLENKMDEYATSI